MGSVGGAVPATQAGERHGFTGPWLLALGTAWKVAGCWLTPSLLSPQGLSDATGLFLHSRVLGAESGERVTEPSSTLHHPGVPGQTQI